MPYAVAAKNAMLTSLGALVTHVSLHTADPGTTGANPVTGGTYARIPVTWITPVGGVTSNVAAIVFNVPAGTTVSWVGMWGALTAGTFYGAGDVVDEVYAGAGTYTIAIAAMALDLNA